MKRKIIFILSVLGLTASLLAFTGSNFRISNETCPLIGTPACPEFPSCCE